VNSVNFTGKSKFTKIFYNCFYSTKNILNVFQTYNNNYLETYSRTISIVIIHMTTNTDVLYGFLIPFEKVNAVINNIITH